jgi:DNA-binding NarL/FixJ family response regulator
MNPPDPPPSGGAPGAGEAPVEPPITVALVEDDEDVWTELAAVINTSPGLRCDAAYKDAETALRQLPVQRAAVVLMDIHLPGMSGIECVRQLKELVPAQLIVMLTAYEDEDLIFQALAAGATGYLVKRCSAAELRQAIVEVHRGGAPMSSSIARKVIRSFHQAAAAVGTERMLSLRQQEILAHLAKGYTYKEISELLGVTFATVNHEIGGIYRKLHVHSREAAVARFRR